MSIVCEFFKIVERPGLDSFPEATGRLYFHNLRTRPSFCINFQHVRTPHVVIGNLHTLNTVSICTG